MEMERVKGRDSDRRERRKFPRVKDKIFIFCKLKGDYRVIEGITKDISEMGLGFESDKFVPPSTLMEMEIYQPLDYLQSKIVSIYLLAKVVWVKEIRKRSRCTGSNKYIGGVKFAKISRKDRNIIVNYAKQKLGKKGSSFPEGKK